MNAVVTACFLILMLGLSHCRDYYIGMFKRNDYLVAQDRLYKDNIPFRKTYAKYGRVFNCPITYFRIVDRLGHSGGPTVEIIRGGLLKKYIVARLTSPFNTPISVNIYVGCENKMVRTAPTTTEEPQVDAKGDNDTVTESDMGGNVTVNAGGNSTDAAEEEQTTTT